METRTADEPATLTDRVAPPIAVAPYRTSRGGADRDAIPVRHSSQGSRIVLGSLFLTLALLPGQAEAADAEAANPARPNILFIAVDDLRPEIACFGAEGMHTPNLDRLAARGVRFERAYCNVPVCGASRASLMTGVRPAFGRFRSYDCYAEEEVPGAIPLHTHLQSHGYVTAAAGKIFHNGDDHAGGWSHPHWRPKRPQYATKAAQRAKATSEKAKKRGPAWEAGDVRDEFYADGALAQWGSRRVGELSAASEPYFLAIGFYKPHLPFVAPQRDYDRYEPTDPLNYFVPPSVPSAAVHNSGELRSYAGIPMKGLVPLSQARDLVRGYHACVSYIDRQVGHLLDAVDASGEADRTIIVLWGDHGWNLGEHSMWCKHCCFETSMRTPLFVSAPQLGGPTNAASQSLVEFTDIYPTLCELAAVPPPNGTNPQAAVEGQLEGDSLVPLLRDPSATVRDWAIGRYGLGDTLRTDRYRYTEYRNRRGDLSGTMLYDHENDPDELKNLAGDGEYAEIVAELARTLDQHKGRDN